QHSENENQITACNAYTTPDGKHTWTSSGTEQDVFTAASGCDSVVIYSVTILHDQENNVSISSCDTYTTPDGSQTWSASGTYQYILPAIGGCDSIITVALTITTFDLSVIENDASLTANQSDANYQWIDCNSGLTLEDETSQNFHPKHNGSYAVIIERNSCLDTSDCFVVTSVGIHDLPFSEVIKIYPNPVHDIMYISFNKPWQHIAIEMTDVFGRVVYDTSYTDVQQIRIQPGLMDGVYFIKMATDGKEAVFKVVLE
ncbi:MAG: T9SS type A sorting domain-containing protein, partial [Saprospiraceae bacterium]